MEEEIKDDRLYSPRELSKITEFAKNFGSVKHGNVKESTVYYYIIKAIKRGLITAKNRGLGQVPYYKITGEEAKKFIQTHLS